MHTGDEDWSLLMVASQPARSSSSDENRKIVKNRWPRKFRRSTTNEHDVHWWLREARTHEAQLSAHKIECGEQLITRRDALRS
jgi:hypothetical protein